MSSRISQEAKIKPVKSSAELKSELKCLTSIWSDESIISTRGVVYLCELMERLLSKYERAKRPLSPWQRFFAQGIKKGKTAVQVAAEWKKVKGAQ